jgi:BirA family biotin operon repressor/biotin-[acetyl-CoA-carboxylase] ligase
VTKQRSVPHYNYDVLDSTNTQAKRLFAQLDFAPFAVISERQTHGRGRRGHSWFSQSDGGLYYSLLVRPKVFEAERLEEYHQVIGRRVSDMLNRELGEGVDLEWPNDLILAQKKVGGILLESSGPGEGMPKYVIVGVGLNLNQTEFPGELKAVAISFRQQTHLEYDKHRIAKKLSEELQDVFERH